MRRFLFAALLTLSLCSSAFAMENELDGVWGIKWGDSILQHKERFEHIPFEGEPIGKEPFKIMEYLTAKEYLDVILTGEGISGVTYYFDEKGFFYAAQYQIRGPEAIKKELGEYLTILGKEDKLLDTHDDEGEPIMIWLWFGKKTQAIFSISADGAFVDISQLEGKNRVNKFYEEQKAKKDS